MRLNVNAVDLAHTVKVTATAISTRPSMPVLAGVLITANEDHIVLASFDFDAVARARVGAIVAEGGTVLVSHRLLAQVISSVKSGDITLDDTDGPLTVTSGRAVWKLPRMVIEDYPSLPRATEQFACVDADEFAAAVESVAVAAASESLDPSRPLDVVQVAVSDGHLTLASIDGYRLHTALSAATLAPDAEGMALVPARRLTAMVKHLGHGEVRLTRSDGLFGVEDGTASLSTRLVESDKGWNNWQAMLDATEANQKASAIMDRADMLAALRQVSGFAQEAGKGARHITLTFTAAGELELSAGTAAEGSGSAVVESAHDGPGIRVVGNVNYLTEAVAMLTGPMVRLSFSGPKKPIGLGNDGGPPVAVVMPVGGANEAKWLDEAAAVTV